MRFDPGFEIAVQLDPIGFVYGSGVIGPTPELRSFEQIRYSLMDADCSGPEYVYGIAMDVCRAEDKADLLGRNLLYGVVTYAAGRLGQEPIRSQGHRHAVSPSCGTSTPEVYEIWEGKACIYMQKNSFDDAGSCYAIYGNPGDVIIVPPGWIHATINACSDRPMTFGAWCVRDYGFDYTDVRRRGGIAFFPRIEEDRLVWVQNRSYTAGQLIEKNAREYPELGLEYGVPIYRQYQQHPDRFRFVTHPQEYAAIWDKYIP